MIPGTFYSNVFQGYVPNIQEKEWELSQTTAITAALCMKYIRAMQFETISPALFIVSLPGKASCAPWITFWLTLNLLKAELPEKANRRIEDLGLEGGEIIDLYGTTSQYIGICRETGIIKLRFANELITHAKPETAYYINRTGKKRLTQPKTYKKKKAETKGPKPIARLLDLETNPNLNSLTSKVFVCSGHGMTKSFKSALDIEIMGENAETIVGLDINLLVKSRLNNIEKAVKPDAKALQAQKDLKISLSRLQFASESLQEEADALIDLIGQPDEAEGLYRRFNKLCDAVNEDPEEAGLSEKMKNLRGIIPKPSPNPIPDLKAVVLNDVALLEDYPETIAHLLNIRKPVILLADHSAEDYRDLKMLARLSSHQAFAKAYAFSWTKPKLAALFHFAPASRRSLIDRHSNILQQRYAEQRVEIVVRDNPALDQAYRLLESRKLSAYLRSEEDVKILFFKHIRPLLCVVKNCFSLAARRAELESQIREARTSLLSFERVLHRQAFDQILNGLDFLAKAIEANEFGAPVLDIEGVFCEEIPVGGVPFIAPESPVASRVYIDAMQGLKSLAFSGLPYQEYKRAALWRAVFGEIIPAIKVFALPEEAGRIRRYLSSRFEAVQFPDALPDDWELPKFLIESDEADGYRQLFSIVRHDQATGEEMPEDDLAEVEQEFNQVKYSRLISSTENPEDKARDYHIPCNVLHFTDDSFLFLPKGDKVLAVFPFEEESVCEYLEFHKLKPGQDVVVYSISKKTLVDIVETKASLSDDLDQLYEWRDVLTDLKTDVHSLCGRLESIARASGLNSSINEMNIKRWLYDEYLLSPENDNLRNILYLKYSADSMKEMEDALKRINEAKRKVMKARRLVRQKADTQILDKLKQSARLSDEAEAFKILIDNVAVDCRRARISQLEPCKDLQVPYNNIYKIYD